MDFVRWFLAGGVVLALVAEAPAQSVPVLLRCPLTRSAEPALSAGATARVTGDCRFEAADGVGEALSCGLDGRVEIDFTADQPRGTVAFEYRPKPTQEKSRPTPAAVERPADRLQLALSPKVTLASAAGVWAAGPASPDKAWTRFDLSWRRVDGGPFLLLWLNWDGVRVAQVVQEGATGPIRGVQLVPGQAWMRNLEVGGQVAPSWETWVHPSVLGPRLAAEARFSAEDRGRLQAMGGAVLVTPAGDLNECVTDYLEMAGLPYRVVTPDQAAGTALAGARLLVLSDVEYGDRPWPMDKAVTDFVQGGGGLLLFGRAGLYACRLGLTAFRSRQAWAEASMNGVVNASHPLFSDKAFQEALAEARMGAGGLLSGGLLYSLKSCLLVGIEDKAAVPLVLNRDRVAAYTQPVGRGRLAFFAYAPIMPGSEEQYFKPSQGRLWGLTPLAMGGSIVFKRVLGWLMALDEQPKEGAAAAAALAVEAGPPQAASPAVDAPQGEAALGQPVSQRGVASAAPRPGSAAPAFRVDRSAEFRYAWPSGVESGAVSLWVRPEWSAGQPRDDRVLFALWGDERNFVQCRYRADYAGLDLLWRGDGRTAALRRQDLRWAAGGWHHVACAWGTVSAGCSLVTFYVDGKRVGSVMGRPWRGITGPAARPDLYVGSGPGGHGFDGDVADVAAWSGQRFLGQAIEGVAADARTSDWPDTAEETARLERFGQARKIAYMLNRTSRDKACKPGTYGAFHGIRFLYVNEETVPKGALDGMDAIHMPGGDAYPLPPETVKAIQEFVRNGGGYVGICAGALYAKADLLNILPFEDRGPGGKQIAIVELDPAHPISRGIESTIHLVGLRIKSLRYGGPWMEPLAPERTRKVGWFAGDGREGAILAGEFGKGRVVLFSNHPEFPAFDAWHGDARNTLQLRRLYRNAMYWAARFETGEDDAPRP